jgi:hypothetical protein
MQVDAKWKGSTLPPREKRREQAARGDATRWPPSGTTAEPLTSETGVNCLDLAGLFRMFCSRVSPLNADVSGLVSVFLLEWIRSVGDDDSEKVRIRTDALQTSVLTAHPL